EDLFSTVAVRPPISAAARNRRDSFPPCTNIEKKSQNRHRLPRKSKKDRISGIVQIFGWLRTSVRTSSARSTLHRLPCTARPSPARAQGSATTACNKNSRPEGLPFSRIYRVYRTESYASVVTLSSFFIIENIKTAERRQRTMNTVQTAHRGIPPQRNPPTATSRLPM